MEQAFKFPLTYFTLHLPLYVNAIIFSPQIIPKLPQLPFLNRSDLTTARKTSCPPERLDN